MVAIMYDMKHYSNICQKEYQTVITEKEIKNTLTKIG